jgi:type VI secretion system Hcp family effector
MGPFVFTAKSSGASPLLMQYCASGDPVGKCELHARRAAKGGKQEDFLNWTLENAVLSSYSHNSPDGGDSNLPVDVFSLAFSKIAMAFKPQDEKGSHQAAKNGTYDLKKMSK